MPEPVPGICPSKAAGLIEGAGEKSYESKTSRRGVSPHHGRGIPSLSPYPAHGRGSFRAEDPRGHCRAATPWHPQPEEPRRPGVGSTQTERKQTGELWRPSGSTLLETVWGGCRSWNRSYGQEGLILRPDVRRNFTPAIPGPFSVCFGDCVLTHHFITPKNTCSDAVTQDTLNRVDIYLALHKLFIVS